jgi:hypothetical protein
VTSGAGHRALDALADSFASASSAADAWGFVAVLCALLGPCFLGLCLVSTLASPRDARRFATVGIAVCGALASAGVLSFLASRSAGAAWLADPSTVSACGDVRSALSEGSLGWVSADASVAAEAACGRETLILAADAAQRGVDAPAPRP